jgi:hypothetical protein
MANTWEMVTNTLWVMSMGIMQVSKDACSHLPTFNKNSKDPPFDVHQQINRGHQNL